MRITRLEVFGFKSFLEKLVLPMEAGITGVVGPNGCGKSNIVDALRWVLGETRASNLRGGTLEDVIFNGTDKLRPLGLAEVTLSLRASRKDFFEDLTVPFPELKNLPGLLAASEPTKDTENGLENDDENIPSSKKPVNESDGGTVPPIESVLAELDEAVAAQVEPGTIGRPQLTVIDGALSKTSVEVDLDASSVSAEALAVQDGQNIGNDIAKEESKQEYSEDEIEQAQVMLTRFAWLKAVEEVQVTRRLYRSGESEFFINRVPCRLRDLKDLFRVIGLGARAYTIVAQGEVSRIVTARAEERRQIIEEAAGVSGFRDKIAASKKRLDETSVNISRLEDVIKEVQRQVNSLRLQASRARNREQLKSRIAELETALFKDGLASFASEKEKRQSSLDQARMEEEKHGSCLQKQQAEEQEVRGYLMSVDVESDTLRAQMDAIKEELDNRVRARSNFTSQLVELRAHIKGREGEIESLEERKVTLQERLEEVAVEIENLQAQDISVSQQINNVGEQSEEELREIANQLAKLREDFKAKEGAIRTLRDNLISAESRQKALLEQIVAASPITQLKAALDKKQLGQDMIKAETFVSQLEKGVEILANGLSVPSEYARAVQAVLAERAAFVVSKDPYAIARSYVSHIRQGGSPEETPAIGVLRAIDSINIPEIAPAIPEVPFVRALDKIGTSESCALAVRRLLSNVYFCDSLEQALEWFEGEGCRNRECVLVTREGDVVTDYSFFSIRHEGGVIQLKKEAEELQLACSDMSLRYEESARERENLQLATVEAETRHSLALAENQRRQAQARELANQQGTIRGRLQAALRLSSQVEQDIRRIGEQIVDMHNRIADYRRQENEVQQALSEMQPGEEQDQKEQLDELRRQYQGLDGVRREGRERLSEASIKVDESRRLREAAREFVSHCDLELQKIEIEFSNLKARFAGEYGQEALKELEQSVAVGSEIEDTKLSDQQRSEFLEESQKLRARIIREGEVDSTSIQRFEEEQARLENLSSQKQDLVTAAETLTRTIERLVLTSEKRFLATFSAVSNNFSGLIPRLYGGGKGNLELLDPAHPLESGVEIIVRPPGKKLKTIDLMSGGEKALCAIGLIFALFLHRPSPLCVLDEVDAPLDEANLMRYLAMVKEMSNATQFIMITHNKQSMAMADQLVGVTMQQPGATRIISVSLQEAYTHAA